MIGGQSPVARPTRKQIGCQGAAHADHVYPIRRNYLIRTSPVRLTFDIFAPYCMFSYFRPLFLYFLLYTHLYGVELSLLAYYRFTIGRRSVYTIVYYDNLKRFTKYTKCYSSVPVYQFLTSSELVI